MPDLPTNTTNYPRHPNQQPATLQRDAHSFRVARSDPDVRSRSSPHSTHLRSPLRSFFKRPGQAASPDTGCWVRAPVRPQHTTSLDQAHIERAIIAVADMSGGGPLEATANLSWLVDGQFDGNTTIIPIRQLGNGPDDPIFARERASFLVRPNSAPSSD